MSNPGRKRLRRIQFGRELTRGTAVATTTRWRGMGDMPEDARTIEEIEEEIGLIDGADRTATTALLGKLTLAETPLTPEQFPYLTAMSMNGPITGTADGGGSGRIYTTPIPFDASNSPNVTNVKSYTVQAGDDRSVDVLTYVLCTKYSIKLEAGKLAMMSGDLVARSVEPLGGNFSTAAIPPVNDLVSSTARVYLDAISGSFGGSLVSNNVLKAEITIEVMWGITYTLSGILWPDFFKYNGHKITGKITFEHDTVGIAARADFRAQTPRLLRLDIPGSTLTTPGSQFSTRLVRFDLPIKYTSNPPLADQDGNDIVVLDFRSRYNVTAGTAGAITVVNELATLP